MLDGFHQSALYLRTGVVGMMEYAELGVSTLAMEVELSVLFLVEVDTPLHQFLNLFGSHTYHLLYSLTVADIVAGNHGVLDMLVEVVNQKVGY